MDRNRAKRLQALQNKVSFRQGELTKEMLGAVKSHLESRGHRADLVFTTKASRTDGRFAAEIRFDPQLSHPREEDLMAIAQMNAPNHDIDWANVDVSDQIVYINLEPSLEMIPLASINDIPPEFVAIGTALYKRAADASGNVNEIWSLKKAPGGDLALYRDESDMEITSDDEGFKAGDIINTDEFGPGRIVRLDENQNAFVQCGKTLRFVAQKSMKEYSIDKEKQKLKDYYSKMYGDEAFSEALTKSYGDRAGK